MGRDRAAYLGDAPADIRAARANGIGAIAAAWSPTARLEALLAEHPDVLLRSVPELCAWAERWVAGTARRKPPESTSRSGFP